MPALPGLYAIYGNDEALTDLDLELSSASPLYIGKAEDSLVARELRGHFASDPRYAARTGSSTVRRSFAALLRDSLDLHAIPRNISKPERFANYGLAADGDERLTAWMHSRLSLAVWVAPVRGPALLDQVETLVIQQFGPPLNIAKNPEKLPRLSRARREMAAEAAAFAGRE